MNSDPAVKRVANKEKHRKVGVLEHFGEVVGRNLGQSRVRAWLRACYHRMLLWRSGGRGIRCELPAGETVRVLPGYRFAAWSQLEYEAFKAATKPGDTVLDVGANIGAYALLFGQWVGSNGKVFAFEPAPETFDALSRQVAMNRLDHVVFPQRLAISDHAAILNFHADSFHGTNRLLSGDEPDAASRKVQALTIDGFCSQHGLQPDLIKIDIEGFELAALRGARETIRAGRGRLTLFVEMHPTTWKQIGIARENILAELDLQGLNVDPFTDQEDTWEVEGVCVRLAYKA